MILITGASGGLGDFLVGQLAKDHTVVGTFNTHKPAVPRRENVEYHQVDVSDSTSVGRFAETIEDKLDHVVLVNLAGISLDGMGHKMDEATWDRVLDTNLKGTFLMSRAILPFMRKQEWGRIINVSSIVGQKGVPGTAAYSASKGGLYSLTRTLAAENATKNITVNALALGYFEVGMINVLKPEVQEQIRATIPMRRLGHPRNVNLAIRFLMEADYVTGAILSINGGLI
jgi:acetoacetyl-CoA reductase/3-oxoacyl-[acyl-carrier protein] reductase